MQQEQTMAANKGNRTKRSVKNRARGKQVAARRKKARHLKTVRRGQRSR